MLTKTDILNKVKAFKAVNKGPLTYSEKAKLYSLIIEDYNKQNKKAKKAFKKLTKATIEKYGRRGLMIWPCIMHNVKSSFIQSIGYCSANKVLKVVIKDSRPKSKTYAYAYIGVNRITYDAFMTAKDKGGYYNNFIKGKYFIVGLI